MNIKLLSRILLVPSILFFGACGGNDDDDRSPTPNGGGGGSTAATLSLRLRENFVYLVVVPVFTDLSDAARDLEVKVQALSTTRKEMSLTAARSSWVQTRVPWEQSEAALFGPTDIFGIDPAIVSPGGFNDGD